MSAMQELELARDNFLRPNGLGGYLISYSQLGAWQRCQLQAFYQLRARNDPDAPQPEWLSATVYGSVMHHALHILEQLLHEGREDALDVAERTFTYYWHPSNLHELGLKITAWVPRTTWAGLNARGVQALREYADMRSKDKATVLALEYEFAVPITVDGRVHTLVGFIDRLAIAKKNAKPYIESDDFKTGKQPTYLRWNQQGTAYSYATTCEEFWTGFPNSGANETATFEPETVEQLERVFAAQGQKLHRGQAGDDPLGPRHFRWINLQEIKYADGGWRNDRDYARFHLMVDAYVRASEAGIYSLNPSGDVCHYCAFRGTCGGVGLPPEEAGAP